MTLISKSNCHYSVSVVSYQTFFEVGKNVGVLPQRGGGGVGWRKKLTAGKYIWTFHLVSQKN
jgi:hypothetical protein